MNHSGDSCDPKDFVYDKLPSIEDRMFSEIERQIIAASELSTLMLSPDAFDDNAVTIAEDVLRHNGFASDSAMVHRLMSKTIACALTVRENCRYRRSAEE